MAAFTKPKTIAEAEAAEVVIAGLYLDRVEAVSYTHLTLPTIYSV